MKSPYLKEIRIVRLNYTRTVFIHRLEGGSEKREPPSEMSAVLYPSEYEPKRSRLPGMCLINLQERTLAWAMDVRDNRYDQCTDRHVLFPVVDEAANLVCRRDAKDSGR